MNSRTFTAALAALSLLIISFGLAACGDDDSVSQEELERATEEAAKEARQDTKKEQELDELRQEVEALQEQEDAPGTAGGGGGGGGAAPATGGGLPANAVDCGAGVFAREGTTSCGFALNVAADYFSSPSNSFDSFSPATGEIYRMTCTGAAPVTCTGGNNAAVYIP